MASNILASKIYTKDELCIFEKIPEPTSIIIFGASGDLTHRKLIPSLLYLQKENLMPKGYYILGVARTKMSDQAFRDKIRSNLPKSVDPKVINKLLDRCHYLAGDYGSQTLHQSLKTTLAELDKKFSIQARRIFYLSTPPKLYSPIIQALGDAGLASQESGGKNCVRVIIEKPFGHSLSSANELNQSISKTLSENQVYRIDHYLGKETVQNILMFRFANILFEPVWNRNYIDQIQITAAEKIGIEHRAGYYEQAGVIRDMFQNHLLQLLALIAMEPPTSLNANAVRDKKVDVFRSTRIMKEAEVEQNSVCGQYSAGKIDGQKVSAYRDEKGVNPNSKTPTFAALKIELDNWRWQGVPIYIRSGKRMAQKSVDISITFKRVPTSIFKPLLADQISPNVLKFRIQPDEGITMKFEAKHPGPKLCMSTVTMDFGYQDTFGTPPPESYARLFLDAMLGDQTLFARSDGVVEMWRIVDPIINFWDAQRAESLPLYPAGSWGPKEADTLLARQGNSWD